MISKKHTKPLFSFLLAFFFSLLTSCCGASSYPPSPSRPIEEKPSLYTKDIEVIVTDMEKRRWFGGTFWYRVELSVKSEEYHLTADFTAEGSGLFGCPVEWEYQEGGILIASLHSWVLESTGEVTKQEIIQLRYKKL